MKEGNRSNLARYSKWLALVVSSILIISGLVALFTAGKWGANLEEESNAWLTAYISLMGFVLTLTGGLALWSAGVVATNPWLANKLHLVAGIVG